MNLSRLDLVSLALFVAVARLGSISAGARHVHLAVGAASRRVSDLEAAVGTPLLYRTASGVVPTDAGAAFLPQAQRVLAEVDRLTGVMADFASGVRGQVRVAANTSSITQFLPEDLSVFMAGHPAVRIALEEQNSDVIVEAVLENRADLGIFADRTDPRGLVTVPYRDDELVLIVPLQHPLAARERVAFADALEYDCVSLPASTSLATRLREEGERLGRVIRMRIEVRSFDAICRMVVATQAVGVLPRLAAEPHALSMPIQLLALDDAWARRTLLIGVRDPEALSAPARRLWLHLQQAFPEREIPLAE